MKKITPELNIFEEHFFGIISFNEIVNVWVKYALKPKLKLIR